MREKEEKAAVCMEHTKKKKTFVLTTFHIQRVRMRRMHITLFDFVESPKMLKISSKRKRRWQDVVFLLVADIISGEYENCHASKPPSLCRLACTFM